MVPKHNPKQGLSSSRNLFILGIIVMLGGIVAWVMYSINSQSEETNEGDENFAGQYASIDTVGAEGFDSNKFTEGVEEQLLTELGICDTIENSEKLPCSPQVFRFFRLNKDKPLKDAFILLINARAFPDENGQWTARRILVFERESGKLVETNRFMGNITEIRKPFNGSYNDLLLRFRNKEKTVFYCSYRWINRRYEFYQCEEIAEQTDRAPRFVSPKYIDSVSLVVKGILTSEELAF